MVDLVFLCHECKQRFDTTDDRDTHYVVDHLDAGWHMCATCLKAFMTTKNYLAHNHMTWCGICGEGFESLEMMLYHIERNHKTICHAILPKMTTSFPCMEQGCNSGFNLSNRRDMHYSEEHVPNRDLLCATCLQAFSHIQEYNIHVANHSKKFPCGICGENTAQNNHVTVAHRDIIEGYTLGTNVPHPTGEFQCFTCKAPFSSSDDRATHFDMEHKRPNPGQVCRVCMFVCDSQEGLPFHEQTHTLRCGVCQATFYESTVMKHHIFSEHSLLHAITSPPFGSSGAKRPRMTVQFSSSRKIERSFLQR